MRFGEVAIRLEGLTKRYGDVAAVDGLTLEVGRGELFGLVGPDGAGKTTTLRMLAGVLRPTAGEATVLGVSMTRDPEAAKPHLAYMSQRFGLYADLTVRENIDFYADLYRVPERDRPERLERLYGFSGLGEFEDRLAGALSGGMKQKLGLCCALIHRPGILLLDEPTFGVDPISRRDLWLIVHEMVADGVTVVVSTAYMDEAERFDRLALMHRGRALTVDSPSSLQDALAGAMLAIEVDRVREAEDIARAHPEAVRVALFGDRLHVRVAEGVEAGRAIAKALRAAGLVVHDVRPIAPSLEDVFIDRIGEEEAA